MAINQAPVEVPGGRVINPPGMPYPVEVPGGSVIDPPGMPYPVEVPGGKVINPPASEGVAIPATGNGIGLLGTEGVLGSSGQLPPGAKPVTGSRQPEKRTRGISSRQVAYPSTQFKGAESYFDPSKSTVQGQLQGLLSDSNPLMQQAKSRAMQQANARGLQNSSLAATAGQAAMYDAALPIASQDAQTYQALNMLNADYDIKTDFWNKQNAFDKMALEKNLSADERQFMTSAFSGMFNNVISAANRIMVDDTLDAAGKRNAIDEIWQNYQDSVKTFSDLNNYDYEW